jgi:hypothetical protein
MSCFQVNVAGSGSAYPSTVKFPGAYSANDPGILIDIHSERTHILFTILHADFHFQGPFPGTPSRVRQFTAVEAEVHRHQTRPRRPRRPRLVPPYRPQRLLLASTNSAVARTTTVRLPAHPHTHVSRSPRHTITNASKLSGSNIVLSRRR